MDAIVESATEAVRAWSREQSEWMVGCWASDAHAVARDDLARLVEVALAASASAVEALCHWTPDSTETHEDFHYGNPCPYAVVAAVLRGEADPREGRPGSTLVADLRAERDQYRERVTAQRRELAALHRTLDRLRDPGPPEPTPAETARAEALHRVFVGAVMERAAAGDVHWLASRLIDKDAKHAATIARLENQREALRGGNRLRRERNGQAERANRLEADLAASLAEIDALIECALEEWRFSHSEHCTPGVHAAGEPCYYPIPHTLARAILARNTRQET